MLDEDGNYNIYAYRKAENRDEIESGNDAVRGIGTSMELMDIKLIMMLVVEIRT